ncbi:MAG: UDP-N-acetylmuramoyl-tripeptide--D-alanyl-D-alanine ligase [Candidatus Nealsonbacteria bacterium DGGOD1a]|nr:MAG: UDP-N-acetylmuramoyl-tripeptide--D-alanyl-D-alanine ligase [Candidatus Nealsonbacteria bacterium DGGOD1a]
MEFWAYPYLIWYLAMFLFWMLAAHRQILFWLYLWQLKEYHSGRFLAHFETAKGKSIFINPLFLAKAGVLIFGYLYLMDSKEYLLSIVAIFLIFFAQAAVSLANIAKKNLLQPAITKKSLLLAAASHILLFGAAILFFNVFLGEMSVPDFAAGAFWLLLFDVLIPLIVSAVVLILQPLTIWQKNKILKKAAAVIEKRPDLTVIGIVGSYGKSVTKELLAAILSERFKVLKTQANQNTEMGVALAIINNLKPEHQIFVCEIGAVHKGRIKQVAGIVKPKIGIITGINQQHLGVFGGQKNIIDGKFEILDALPKNGTAILNFNSRLVAESIEKQKIKTDNVILAGKDIWAGEIAAAIDRLRFVLNYKNEKIAIDINARGAFMVEPVLLAVSGAIAAGMAFPEVARIINQTDFTPFNIIFKRVRPFLDQKGRTLLKEIDVFNSTYSANPDGVIAHLDYLKLHSGKKAIIMPCLIELGSASKEIHRQIGQKISQVCDLAIITTGDHFEEIRKAAVGAGMEPNNIVFLEKSVEVKKLIESRLSDGDGVLLEGRLAESLMELFLAVK